MCATGGRGGRAGAGGLCDGYRERGRGCARLGGRAPGQSAGRAGPSRQVRPPRLLFQPRQRPQISEQKRRLEFNLDIEICELFLRPNTAADPARLPRPLHRLAPTVQLPRAGHPLRAGRGGAGLGPRGEPRQARHPPPLHPVKPTNMVPAQRQGALISEHMLFFFVFVYFSAKIVVETPF